MKLECSNEMDLKLAQIRACPTSVQLGSNYMNKNLKQMLEQIGNNMF